MDKMLVTASFSPVVLASVSGKTALKLLRHVKANFLLFKVLGLKEKCFVQIIGAEGQVFCSRRKN